MNFNFNFKQLITDLTILKSIAEQILMTFKL